MLSSLGPLPPVTRSVTAAAALLAHHGPRRGCGCPGWTVDPDAAPARHEGRCPLGALDDVFDAFGAVGPVLQAELDARGSTAAAWRRVAERVRAVEETTLVHASVAYALALVGVARTQVRVQAVLGHRTHDLDDPTVERFAAMDHLTRSDAVPLGPETLARLLLSSDPDAELARAEELAAQFDPDAAAGDLATLFAATAQAVNAEAVKLSGTSGRGPVSFSLPQLASDGFNLLVGMTSAGDLT